jgi:hypothetical protein
VRSAYSSGGTPTAGTIEERSLAGVCPLPPCDLETEGRRSAMRFPERSRRGDAAHASAVERLGAARERQDELTTRAVAAVGTSGEEQTADALGAARDRVAAREAWLVWVERGM